MVTEKAKEEADWERKEVTETGKKGGDRERKGGR